MTTTHNVTKQRDHTHTTINGSMLKFFANILLTLTVSFFTVSCTCRKVKSELEHIGWFEIDELYYKGSRIDTCAFMPGFHFLNDKLFFTGTLYCDKEMYYTAKKEPMLYDLYFINDSLFIDMPQRNNFFDDKYYVKICKGSNSNADIRLLMTSNSKSISLIIKGSEDIDKEKVDYHSNRLVKLLTN